MRRFVALALAVVFPALALAVRGPSPNLDAGDMIIYSGENESFDVGFGLPTPYAFPPSGPYPAEHWNKDRRVWEFWGGVSCRVEWISGGRMLYVRAGQHYDHGEGRCVIPTRTDSEKEFRLYLLPEN